MCEIVAPVSTGKIKLTIKILFALRHFSTTTRFSMAQTEPCDCFSFTANYCGMPFTHPVHLPAWSATGHERTFEPLSEEQHDSS